MVFQRQVAARIFASEYRESDLFFRKEDSEKAPGFMITPTGAEANRVLIVGTLTEKEDKSQDGDGSFIQVKVVDPTGQHYIYVSREYQPEVAAVIAKIEPPRFVSIIAKTGIYDGGDDGVRFSKLRPESISVVDAETRDSWIAETAKITLDRIAGCAEVLRLMGIDGGFTSAADLDDLSEVVNVEAIKKAIGYYGTEKKDLVKWRDMVKLALKSLHPATDDDMEGECEKYDQEVNGMTHKHTPPKKPQDEYIQGSDGRKKRLPRVEEVEL